jgi:hypothetical protein
MSILAGSDKSSVSIKTGRGFIFNDQNGKISAHRKNIIFT